MIVDPLAYRGRCARPMASNWITLNDPGNPSSQSIASGCLSPTAGGCAGNAWLKKPGGEL